MSWTDRRKKDKKTRTKFALSSIKNGISFREASEKFEIPTSTLHYHHTHEITSTEQIFTLDQEKIILEFITSRQQGVPLTKAELLETLNTQFFPVLLQFFFCVFLTVFFRLHFLIRRLK